MHSAQYIPGRELHLNIGKIQKQMKSAQCTLHNTFRAGNYT